MKWKFVASLELDFVAESSQAEKVAEDAVVVAFQHVQVQPDCWLCCPLGEVNLQLRVWLENSQKGQGQGQEQEV